MAEIRPGTKEAAVGEEERRMCDMSVCYVWPVVGLGVDRVRFAWMLRPIRKEHTDRMLLYKH